MSIIIIRLIYLDYKVINDIIDNKKPAAKIFNG